MVDNVETWKKSFANLYSFYIKRKGNEELFGWIEKSDFFEAPASSKYHLAVPGGLCRHSMNVYYRLRKFLNGEYGTNCPYSDESIAIVALLHDLCKANFYTIVYKNQKTYDAEKVANAERWQVKHDNAGDFIWESVATYTINEEFTFGHGEKSVYLVQKFMQLTDEEAQAIRYHMGAFADGDAKDVGKAWEENTLALFLNMADSAATFIDEKEGKG